MKKLFFINVILLFISNLLFSQIAINSDGSAPDPSAGLDVSYTNKGFLLPRLTFEQRNAIASPAEGLIVFCVNCSADAKGALSIFEGGGWKMLDLKCYTPNKPLAANQGSSLNQITWHWDSVPIALGYKWNTINDFSTATDMGSATSYTESGLTCFTDYTRYIWAYNDCGSSPELTIEQSTQDIPFSSAPTEGIHNATLTTVVWHWTPVAEADGYKWNTTPNYNTAINIGTATSTTETDLTCGTNYTRFVWGYNSCGISTPVQLTKTTSADPSAAPIAATHVPTDHAIVWNWHPVIDAHGYKWNTTDNYNTAIDLGTDTTFAETGLSCFTEYTRYIWDYNGCAVSSPTTLTQTSSVDVHPNPVPAINSATATQIVWNWHPVPEASNYKWSTTNNFNTATELGTDTTVTQIGLICNTPYTIYVWAYDICDMSDAVTLTQATSLNPPGSPVADTHVPSITEIVWNWNAVSGATGYKWNTTNNYTTATDMGTATTKDETGLTCNTPYTRFVWAYSNCGVSAVTSLSQTSSFDPPDDPIAGTHVPSATQIVWNWSVVYGAAGYKWNTSSDYATATDMGAVTSITETGLSCNTSFNRYVWAYSNCGVSASTSLLQSTSDDSPGAPNSGTHVPAPNQIVWNWSAVSGATGYKWSTADNFTSAVDMGNVTTLTETGLTCNSEYARYAWAYNSCGHSTPVSLTDTTLYCWTCGYPFTVNHVAGTFAPVDKTTSYGTVTNVPGEADHCWITSNLGSDHQATTVNDNTEASAGWYWQFDQTHGYKHDGTTRTPNSTWIASISELSNWTSANDPCTHELGTGWRIPTSAEWTNVDASGSWTNWNGPWNSLLKMHAAGRLYQSTGARERIGVDGAYWASNQSSGTLAFSLYFYSSSSGVSLNNKAMAFSIRCLKD
jgi:hypothetical protein